MESRNSKVYYKNILEIKNYEKTKLTNKISVNDISEDLVTYFTQLYFRKLFCRIASVSYPSAQGDRAILSGERKKNRKNIL